MSREEQGEEQHCDASACRTDSDSHPVGNGRADGDHSKDCDFRHSLAELVEGHHRQRALARQSAARDEEDERRSVAAEEGHGVHQGRRDRVDLEHRRVFRALLARSDRPPQSRPGNENHRIRQDSGSDPLPLHQAQCIAHFASVHLAKAKNEQRGRRQPSGKPQRRSKRLCHGGLVGWWAGGLVSS